MNKKKENLTIKTLRKDLIVAKSCFTGAFQKTVSRVVIMKSYFIANKEVLPSEQFLLTGIK